MATVDGWIGWEIVKMDGLIGLDGWIGWIGWGDGTGALGCLVEQGKRYRWLWGHVGRLWGSIQNLGKRRGASFVSQKTSVLSRLLMYFVSQVRVTQFTICICISCVDSVITLLLAGKRM